MPKTYTTQQGDTWDVISLKGYGTELLVAELVSANWPLRDVGIFSAGVQVVIPDATPAQVASTNLPPWRRKA